jgi:hypothetical protein
MEKEGFTTIDDLPEEQAVSQAEQYTPAHQEKDKPESALDNKKLALIIGIIGFIVIGIIFYFLFHSIGII